MKLSHKSESLEPKTEFQASCELISNKIKQDISSIVNFTRLMTLQHNLMVQRLNQCRDPFKYAWNGANYGWNKDGRLFINRITDEQKTELGPWERVREEESKKIAQMSIYQLFDYIQFIVDSDSVKNIETHHCWIMFHNHRSEEIFRVSGLDAAAEYKQTIISILAKLKSQLAGKTTSKKENSKGNSLGLTKRLFNSLLRRINNI